MLLSNSLIKQLFSSDLGYTELVRHWIKYMNDYFAVRKKKLP